MRGCWNGLHRYWTSPTYKALVAGSWDVVIVMLGTNDARDVGSGGPEHWPREQCDDANMTTLGECPYARDYAALLEVRNTAASGEWRVGETRATEIQPEGEGERQRGRRWRESEWEVVACFLLRAFVRLEPSQ